MLWRRILFPILAIIAFVMTSLTVYLRLENHRLSVQAQKLHVENHELQLRKHTNADVQRGKPSVLLDAPISEMTALSFFWFGDMDSHFRLPINFYVVADGDRRLHAVNVNFPRNSETFISAPEMKHLIEGLKALNLYWADSNGTTAFNDALYRNGTEMLDITLVSSNATGKAHIRIANMCDELDRLDSVMPSPRILWQFQTFRRDNGCYINGYDNSVVPPE